MTSSISSCCAIVDALSRTVSSPSSPNHRDSYPYRMIRARGVASGSSPGCFSQLTYCGSASGPIFLLQLSSGCAPMPWIAIMLEYSSISTFEFQMTDVLNIRIRCVSSLGLIERFQSSIIFCHGPNLVNLLAQLLHRLDILPSLIIKRRRDWKVKKQIRIISGSQDSEKAFWL